MAGGAMVASGWLSDRAGRRLPFLVGSIVLVLASYILFAMALPGTALLAYALFVMGWGTVTLSVWMLCTDLVPPAQMAVGTAMINT
ncbi:MFS transporter, partial [Campylobacter jejuni]